MANIKGFKAKNIVEQSGHEGEQVMRCEIYYEDQKIALYNQSSTGGPDELDLVAGPYQSDEQKNWLKKIREAVNFIKENHGITFLGDLSLVDFGAMEETYLGWLLIEMEHIEEQFSLRKERNKHDTCYIYSDNGRTIFGSFKKPKGVDLEEEATKEYYTNLVMSNTKMKLHKIDPKNMAFFTDFNFGLEKEEVLYTIPVIVEHKGYAKVYAKSRKEAVEKANEVKEDFVLENVLNVVVKK